MDDFRIVNGPEGPIKFPKGMSDTDIEEALGQLYPQDTLTHKATPQDMDIAQGVLQGVRDIPEGILAGPAEADNLERSIVGWLKSARPGSPFNTVGEIVGNQVPEETNLLEAKKAPEWFPSLRLMDKAMPTDEPGNFPAPNRNDVGWLMQQAGLPDYQPQTTAGNIARYGTGLAWGGLGGELAELPSGAVAAAKHPAIRRFGKWIGTGAGIGAGHELFKYGKEWLLGPELKPNPGLNILPPVR